MERWRQFLLPNDDERVADNCLIFDDRYYEKERGCNEGNEVGNEDEQEEDGDYDGYDCGFEQISGKGQAG